MSITLLCLVKGNTTANVFSVKIRRNEPVSELKKAIKAEKAPEFDNFPADKLKLWKVEIPGDHVDPFSNLTLNDSNELSAINDIGDYWPTSPPKKHIHVIVKLPLLSLEEALSCIPPHVTYSSECITSKTTTKVNGDPPSSVMLWDNFFEEVNQFCFDKQPIFERPKFNDEFNNVVNEEDVRNVMNNNICQILNKLMGLDYIYSRLPTHTPGIPDFTCRYLKSLILVIEVKRKHILEDINGSTFPEFYQTDERARTVVQQIYNYMGENQLTYGILATYDNHWFLRREHTELRISKTLPLQSESPPVLKAYAYLTRQAKENPNSPHPQVIVPSQVDNNSRTLRSHPKPTSSSSHASSTFANQQSFSSPFLNQQNYNFADFKFKSILGEGRSGKTLLCEFRGVKIALKSADLSKTPPYVLEEMQKEVDIYKELSDIQGKFIPKLVCYGYYGGGMSFIIGTTIVGTILSKQRITQSQIERALKGLVEIHKHGILHNDIREENILVKNNNHIYLIDFGMASREDTKKKGDLFALEQRKYSNLLNRYKTKFRKNVKRNSKSRKSQVVS